MRLVVLLLPVALLACAGSPPPERTSYLMRGPEEDRLERVSEPRVGIRRVLVAPSLSDPGLVVEVEPGQLRAARHYQWAEPLDVGLTRYLRSAVRRALGEEVGITPARSDHWSHAVDLYVDQLRGTSDGDALLVASWLVENREREEVARWDFVRRVPLAGPGYDALAAAELELLSQLAGAIADSLRDLPRE